MGRARAKLVVEPSPGAAAGVAPLCRGVEEASLFARDAFEVAEAVEVGEIDGGEQPVGRSDEIDESVHLTHVVDAEFEHEWAFDVVAEPRLDEGAGERERGVAVAGAGVSAGRRGE